MLALILLALIVIVVLTSVVGRRAAKSKAEELGEDGERHVARILGTLAPEFEVINDLLLPCGKGYVQIDHVVISPVGIIVIETKNYSGAIFGDDATTMWVQDLAGRKRRFYSPVEQNETHCACVRRHFGKRALVYSVVVFSDRARVNAFSDKALLCSFRSLRSLIEGLNRTTAPILDADDRYEIKKAFFRLNDGSEEAKRIHRNSCERHI